ncbi:hypothetical protein F2P81_000844 [Scophthalmus maximus]|uniref:UAP56-interacting factor n=1 Tax=Scophthalmus maximus TaxID=52904 RepID=A0A6A4TXJ6_SCOMX|nr:hypothetical protein F2P81_000844 [Scophthalmus maximus]
MNSGGSAAAPARRPAVPDKVDMSLGSGVPRGGGAPKLRNRRVAPPPGLRRGQGVITGLAARRPTALLKRVGTLNRAAINQLQYVEDRPPRLPFFRKRDRNRGPSFSAPTSRSGSRRSRGGCTGSLIRRGARTQRLSGDRFNCDGDHCHPSSRRVGKLARPRFLFVGDSRPPTAWTLHPPAVSSAPVKGEEVEKKIPKGVPLQFDINSVGKPQTSMTLNERFRIMKDQRTTTAQSTKGSRFVTVG